METWATRWRICSTRRRALDLSRVARCRMNAARRIPYVGSASGEPGRALEIERVPGRAVAVQAQVPRVARVLAKEATNDDHPVAEDGAKPGESAPRHDHARRCAKGRHEGRVVLASDRILDAQQPQRFGRPPGEHVEHEDAAVSPCAS